VPRCDSESLTCALIAARPDLGAPEEAIAAAVTRIVDQATSAWPDGWVDAPALAARIAAALDAGEDAEKTLAALRGDDLYLAAAALAGIAPACATLEEMIHRVAAAVVARMGGDEAAADEVAREVSEKVLVGSAERGPRIADYLGRGSLAGWLRAAVGRTFLNQRRRRKREVLIGDDAVLDALAGDEAGGPSLDHMRALYRQEFASAFEAALRELDDRQRAVLRYRFVDGATVENIAAIYRVHRATCHRWISDARAALARRTERILRARLAVSESEFTSIRRLVESRIELSLSRIFAPGDQK
jgi:RNA polymerase sigma-70 factor, ECF subfamily